MDTRKYMNIIDGEIRTSEVKFCRYNEVLKTMDNRLLADLCSLSMSLLKDKLKGKYGNKGKRVVFAGND